MLLHARLLQNLIHADAAHGVCAVYSSTYVVTGFWNTPYSSAGNPVQSILCDLS